MDDPERTLARRARRGDRDAIGTLLRRASPRLRAAVRSAGVDAAEVDDALQEAMARALARWSEARSDDALESWLESIARNVAIDFRRRSARQRARIIELDPASAIDGANGAAGGGATAGDEPVPGISAEARTILELRYRDGLSGQEIAARLALTYEAAKKRLQRARAEALARLRGRAS